jgi:hypothetical protein
VDFKGIEAEVDEVEDTLKQERGQLQNTQNRVNSQNNHKDTPRTKEGEEEISIIQDGLTNQGSNVIIARNVVTTKVNAERSKQI